ncbi:MAG: DUF502 domain-containing protein [Verrucomicrobia bacterium]|nr:DUF502 domain-containing protein [Verrucomicrobiota bacterium]
MKTRQFFFAGLVVLLPVLVTYVVITFLIGLITAPFEHTVSFLLLNSHLFENGFGIFTSDQIIHFVSKLLIIMTILLSIFLVGFFAARYAFVSWGYIIDNTLLKIPYVRSVYGSAKELAYTFLDPPQGAALSQAVLVPYPTSEQLTMGLVTGEFTFEGKMYISVFVPSTPNTTNGYLCSYPKEMVQVVDLPADEALKYIMSLSSCKTIAVKE